jgi:hypothetical protein
MPQPLGRKRPAMGIPPGPSRPPAMALKLADFAGIAADRRRGDNLPPPPSSRGRQRRH